MILINTLITALQRVNDSTGHDVRITLYPDNSGYFSYYINGISLTYSLGSRALTWIGIEDLEELIEYINNTLDELENDN